MTRQEKEAAILAELDFRCPDYKHQFSPFGEDDGAHRALTVKRCSPPLRDMCRYFVLIIGGSKQYVLAENTTINGSTEFVDMIHLLLGLETRALEDEVRRLKAGIWELSALVPCPNLALKYLNPPTP